MTHHEHVCECGSTLACARADCTVDTPFVCPTCEWLARDEYFQSLELEATQPEPNRNPVVEN